MSQTGMDDFLSDYLADFPLFTSSEVPPQPHFDRNTNLPVLPHWTPEPRRLGTTDLGTSASGEHEIGPDLTINDPFHALVAGPQDEFPNFFDNIAAGEEMFVGNPLGAAPGANQILPNLASEAEVVDRDAILPQIQTPDNVLARRKRRQRAPCPSAANWRNHKATIRRIYLDEDNTLEKTREILREEHGFQATAQMFKEKFQLWGWHKNLPQKLVGKLSRMAAEREPKRTEFRLGPKAWPAEEVIRRAARGRRGEQPAPSHSPDLPSNLIIRTPSISSAVSQEIASEPRRLVSLSPSVFFRAGSISSPRMHETAVLKSPDLGTSASTSNRGGRPALIQTYSRPDRSMPPPTLPPIWSLGRSLTPVIPSRLRIDSQTWQPSPEMFKMDLIRAFEIRTLGGQDEANDKIQNAVSGFMDHKDPLDETKIQIAYEMVETLSKGGEIQRAIALLNWVSERCRELNGVRSEKTLSHYLKVIRFLRSWSRHQDVNGFIHRIMDSWEHKSDHSATATVTDTRAGDELCETITKEDFDNLFIAPGDTDDAEAQLRFAENLLSSNGTKTSALKKPMQRILEFCEERPGTDISVFLKATCCLANVYLEHGRLKRAVAVELNGQKKVEEYLEQDGFPSIKVLSICTRLAFLLSQSRRQDECDSLLDFVAERLEYSVDYSRVFDAMRAVEFFIFVGRQWSQKSSWDAAAPWLERALAAKLRLGHNFGEVAPTNWSLEHALAHREFNEDLTINKAWVDVS